MQAAAGAQPGAALHSEATVEADPTVSTFAQWLTELRARNNRTLQEMLAEMSIIRDGITNNNMELTEFKRNSTGVSQQMQTQLTDLREKLTSAFGEITALVKQKTSSDQEMMQDIHGLQQNLSSKTAELEALKRSYSQAHTQLQSSLIQIQNHLQVTNTEIQAARSACERVSKDASARFATIDDGLKAVEDELNVGNAENRNQMLQLQEEIARIHESLASVSAEFLDHKRATNSVHNKLQSQVWGIEEGRKNFAQGAQASATVHHSLGQVQQHPQVYQQAGAPMSIRSPSSPPSVMAGQPQAMLPPAKPSVGSTMVPGPSVQSVPYYR